jgi:hypothetical protein
MAQELVILTRTYDLLAWLLPKAESFPKLYRRTVVQRLLDAALDFQEALFDAQEAPRFCLWPTEGLRPCGRDPPAPSSYPRLGIPPC